MCFLIVICYMNFSHRFIRPMSVTALSLLLFAGCLSSCTFDDTELQNSIDDLTSRVEALEDFQEQVQGDIASLQDIISKLDSSVTVNNVVDNGDGSWTINFSDGTSVTIRNGQDGEDGLTPPSITVVEEDGTYYWAYEDADGNTEFILDDDGNKIPVTGEAPQVRINEDGYWEISSDGGKTWENTDVKAEGGAGDSFFSNVYVEGGILYLVLADGTVIEVPMTAELAFDFGTDEAVLYFSAGESKTFKYVMSGAETYTITKPDGWRASIEGEDIVITAPVAGNAFAETEGKVGVILISAGGQSLLAEQRVVLGDAPDGQSFEITLGEITSTSAEVTIIPAIKDEYYRVIAFRADLPDYAVLNMMMDDITSYVELYGWEQSIINGLFFIGDRRDVLFDGFPDGQTACFYVVGVDYQNGTPVAVTELYKSEIFTTPAIPESDAWVNMTPGYRYQDGQMVLYVDFFANETTKKVKSAVWYVANVWGDPTNLAEAGYTEKGIRAVLMGDDEGIVDVDMQNEPYLATGVAPGEARMIGVLGFDESGVPGKPNWIILKAPMEPDGTYTILCQSDGNDTGIDEPVPDMTIKYAVYEGIDPYLGVECPVLSLQLSPNEICADYHYSVEDPGYFFSYGTADDIVFYLTSESNRWSDENGWGWRERADTNDESGNPTDKDEIPLAPWYTGSDAELIYVCFDERGVAADPWYITFSVPYDLEPSPVWRKASVSFSRHRHGTVLAPVLVSDNAGCTFKS